MVRRLTVLQMLPALDGGGVERGTLEVAAALAGRGHRSMVMSAGGRLVPELEAGGSEHLAWGVDRKSPWTLRHVLPLRRLLARERVDVLHLRSRVPAWVGWLAWRGMDPALRPRLVTTVHGLYSVGAYSRVMTRGERVIAVSQTVREYILGNYPGVDLQRIRVIPRGVDPDAFPYGWRPASGWLDAWYREHPRLLDVPVLTLPGRLTRLKGHQAFIDLIATLRGRGVSVHGLVVGGEDPRRAAYAADLYREVAQRGLGGDITFAGHRADMREIYAVSDVVCSLSARPESFGRTVLEALSMGRPVIGYDHGGVGELLAELYPEGAVGLDEPEVLAGRAEAFLQQAPAVPREHRFTLGRMLAETLDLYEELVY
jgi:glycosyltransferase involved in cell wall biosynthesis